VYAGGLATAAMLEHDLRGSTVVSALGVWGVAGLLSLGPRRTLAGARELRAHRRALARAAAHGVLTAEYLADVVATYGVVGLRELCGGLVPAGALAPPPPSYEPRPAVESVPAAEPLAVVEPWPAIQPSPVVAWPWVEPWPTAESWPSVEPATAVEPSPAVEPAPLVDPVPAARPAVGPNRSWRLLEPVPAPVVVELPVRRSERMPVAA
ncbi:MAG: hypothetical protein IRY92_03925, partial [Dactylosporangium sp.]|nr:hypothetical protein [Dactylosporangium sp.]